MLSSHNNGPPRGLRGIAFLNIYGNVYLYDTCIDHVDTCLEYIQVCGDTDQHITMI